MNLRCNNCRETEMRALHVVKTSNGAQWAAALARVLIELGIEVHVVLPSPSGYAVPHWIAAGAKLHFSDLSLPIRSPWKMRAAIGRARQLISDISPDVIHSHFVTTTLLLRLALGKNHAIPRIYQVAGPLHLEHWHSRHLELLLAGKSDYWVGSSRYILNLYQMSGIPLSRLFLSYYGMEGCAEASSSKGWLRKLIGAKDDDVLVGNVNYMYSPKYFLGQFIGIKCHEDIIKALGRVIQNKPNALGVFVGGAWEGATWYENKLKKMARNIAGDRIRFTGTLPLSAARSAWTDIDLAVHVPLSENCGGVIEPLLSEVPVIASKVGGLPEVIRDGETGTLVPPRNAVVLAGAIENALEHIQELRQRARLGKKLVARMFDVERTGREIYDIYKYLLGEHKEPPAQFDSQKFLMNCT